MRKLHKSLLVMLGCIFASKLIWVAFSVLIPVLIGVLVSLTAAMALYSRYNRWF